MTGDNKSIQELKDHHQGETGYIVGKGPSILKLSPGDFGSGPIITLNHAIHIVEPLELSNEVYSLQQDGCRPWKGRPKPCPHKCDPERVPQKAPLILSHDLSGECHPNASRYIFHAKDDLAMSWGHCSAVMAVRLLQFFGVNKIRLFGFDALSGDYMTVESYDKCIDHGIKDGYIEGIVQIKKTLADFPHEWMEIDA